MNWIFKTVLLFLIFGVCVNIGFGQQTLVKTIMHDDQERRYILYIPAIYNDQKSAPLVFNFHGFTSNAQQQMSYGDFRPIADTAGFIIVHPFGLLDNAGNTHFNVGWGGSDVDDLGFTSVLIDSLAKDYKIDLDRVYSTGMSNGGFMSYHLACNLSDKIAAIASVTGSMSFLTYDECNPNRPVPVLEIHGTTDLVVPYNGASFAKSIDDVISFWQAHNQCKLTPLETLLDDIDPSDGSTVTHFVYSEGNQQVNTELFKITGGGHTWPGNQFNTPSTNYDIDASLEVWNFFNRYDINGLRTTTSSENVIKKRNSVYPNPSNGNITITNIESKESTFILFNSIGQSLKKGVIKTGQSNIDCSAFANGIYILMIENEMHSIIKL